jgi:hypothetical protein
VLPHGRGNVNANSHKTSFDSPTKDKSEYRNPKSETNINTKEENQKPDDVGPVFGFISSFFL